MVGHVFGLRQVRLGGTIDGKPMCRWVMYAGLDSLLRECLPDGVATRCTAFFDQDREDVVTGWVFAVFVRDVTPGNASELLKVLPTHLDAVCGVFRQLSELG